MVVFTMEHIIEEGFILNGFLLGVVSQSLCIYYFYLHYVETRHN